MTDTSAPGAQALVRKLWHYCNVLRDDGLSYPDYVEQLTYLLFLKMADEQADRAIPSKYCWRSLVRLEPDEMHAHYGRILSALGGRKGMLGLIFGNAKNKIRDPGKLRLLIVDLIGQTEWTGLSDDLKGDAYEGLLEKNARDTKSGAGQYFTPRPLIEAIVQCVNPQLGEMICDPACGTAGFLLVAHDYLRKSNPKMTAAQRKNLATRSIRGVELVEEVARLAAMNLLLHGVGGNDEDELPIECADSLKAPPARQYDVVLTNPPFGIKGSVTYSKGSSTRAEDGLTIVRPDFWVQSANKQLNFMQHIVALLKPGGRAAVVVPDNVLFEGGAAASVRRRLVENCCLHTILKLPPGLFYAAGVKSNVIFFSKPKKIGAVNNQRLWVYDLRSDKRFSLRTRPLQNEDLREFVSMYFDAARKDGERSRSFDVKRVLSDPDCRLDMTWGDPANRPRAPGLARLDELSRLVADDLLRALALIAKPNGQ
ncbi:type I restriction-modification system subunit M [Bradyrhizobium ontarionense]|uniref:site-specific DNA-methyltransferase (adenine-specific) n=1 Tax=Bradyrhizobium ontarionense TaxID=2898149 RepID=A0ABY3RCI7_9BRAD|nr:class I SAM-dependent DNA methyltransferase [Bradyrhizobium sp. A19]UFZ05056.1 type I restriction-modification system subunit M [Bradyrhizobium sp. A19]